MQTKKSNEKSKVMLYKQTDAFQPKLIIHKSCYNRLLPKIQERKTIPRNQDDC